MINVHIDDDIGDIDKDHAEYVLKTFFSIEGIPYKFCDKSNLANSVILHYGQDTGDFPESTSVVYIPYNPNSRKILDPKIKEKDNLLMISDDIISSAFFFLSREEEIDSERDEFGCYPAKNSILYSSLCRPVVNEYFEILSKAIKKCLEKQNLPLIQKWYWPEGKKFAACLTHDIDRIGKWPLPRSIYHLLRFLRYMDLKDISQIFQSKDDFEGVRRVIEIEKRLGLKSTFFIRTTLEKRFSAAALYLISKFINIRSFSRIDAPGYDVASGQMREIIREIRDNGCEVGMHPSYKAHNNADQMLFEKETLEGIIGEKIIGSRQHNLTFEVPTTWEIQDSIGLCYDTTLGFNEAVGFRAGISFPFYPYQRDILEIPLTVMDTTVYHYLEYTIQESIHYITNLIDQTCKNFGLITLLFHSDHFEQTEVCNAYTRILEYLITKDAWITNCSEIFHWWENRNCVRFVEFNKWENHYRVTYKSDADINDLSFNVRTIISKDSMTKKIKVKTNVDFILEEKRDAIWILFKSIKRGEIIHIDIDL